MEDDDEMEEGVMKDCTKGPNGDAQSLEVELVLMNASGQYVKSLH